MSDYETGAVTSADGTTFGYRRLGHGPALILLHGGMQAAQNLMSLARILAADFDVYVPDRRGRGLSGPQPEPFDPMRSVEDVQALVSESGASRIFGLSAGALVALRSALDTPALSRVALYEPPLSVNGSVPAGWVPRYEKEVAAGDLTGALITNLKGLRTEPVLGGIPRAVLAPVLSIGSRFQRTAPGDVPILDLVPTQRADMALIAALADTAAEYATVSAEVLLMEGSKSPSYFGTAMAALSAVLPHSRRVTLPGLRHSGPDDDGRPEVVAKELRSFFA